MKRTYKYKSEMLNSRKVKSFFILYSNTKLGRKHMFNKKSQDKGEENIMQHSLCDKCSDSLG